MSSQPEPPEPAAASVRRSAQRLEQSAGVQESSADRRTELAANRTVLAGERTYAAWVRTGLGALASGVGARALFARILPAWFGAATGTLLIVFSAFCFLAAVWRELEPGASPPKPETRHLPTAMLLVLNGGLIIVDAAALVGIWWARA